MVVSAAALPVSADYTAATYDVEALKSTFDSGTADGRTAADGKALKIEGTESDVFRLGTYPEGLDSTKEFLLSFDFKFDTEAGSLNIKSDASKDNVGPSISYDADNSKKNQNKLVTQTGGTAWQSLGDFTVGEWYTMEIEGITGNDAKLPTCRLYNYPNGTKTLVQETQNMNFRNLGSNTRHFSFMLGTNVTVDNVLIVQENPDTIEVTTTSADDTMDAGTNISLDYTMKRGEVEFTKYPVEWSLVGNPTGVSLNNNALVADITATAQTVTVQAKATFGGKDLVGTTQIEVKAIDTSDEKFDVITVAGADEIKAGESGTYTVTATKQGALVTLADDDVVWKVYNADNLKVNGNKNITLVNGNLNVDESVLPQKIYVRAESESGKVSNAIPVNITKADSLTETVYLTDACETAVDTVDRDTVSADGSAAYHTASATTFQFGNKDGYILTELDFKLDAEGSGFRLKREDGTENSSFVLHGADFAQQTGSSSYPTLIGSIDKSKWYHFEMIYSAGVDASCNVYTYNDDGTLSETPQTFTGLNQRNNKGYGKLEVQAGTYVDNIKITSVSANELVLDVANDHVYAGDTLQATATVSYNGLPIKGAAGLQWDVLDSSDKVITGDNAPIKISGEGLLTVSPTAQAQTIKIRLTSGTTVKTQEIEVLSRDIFEITNIGVNEEKTRIEKLYLNKKFNYKDEVMFVFAIYRSNALVDVKTIQTFGDTIAMGETNVAVGYDLPADFDPETDKIRVYTWTRF